MRKETRKYIFALALLVVAIVIGGCGLKAVDTEQTAESSQIAEERAENPVLTYQMQPTLEVSPTEAGENGWLVAAADEIELKAQSSGAKEVKFNFSPAAYADSDYYVVIAALKQPADEASGAFVHKIKLPADFAGEIWVEAVYPDDSIRESEPVSVATRRIIGEVTGQKTQVGDESGQNTGQNAESVEPPADETVYITANAPSFRLTLWNDGRAEKTYEIGIGRKSHPIPIGDRKASEVILNPSWIPPDSPWVRRMRNVSPGERIDADDPRNPLGSVKIPLGNAYLIHEAAKPSDIGSLVSHGCIRLTTDDLFDLTGRLSEARELSLSAEEIERARRTTERKTAPLKPPLPVRITYDTAIIENERLHLYPDVYDRKTNTAKSLREFLQAKGVDAAQMTDETLDQLWAQVSMKEKFVVSLADFRAGRALERGRKEPITSESVKTEKSQTADKNKKQNGKRK